MLLYLSPEGPEGHQSWTYSFFLLLILTQPSLNWILVVTSQMAIKMKKHNFVLKIYMDQFLVLNLTSFFENQGGGVEIEKKSLWSRIMSIHDVL